MKKVIDKKKLDFYVDKYEINDIFSIDMKQHMELFVFGKNEYICKAGEKLDYFFFFVEGKAKVYASLSNGKSLLLCFYSPFKIIGEVELSQDYIVESSIQVIKEAYCIGISMENLRKYLLDDSKFLRFACQNLGQKLNRLSKYSSINLLYPLENRLASYIMASRTRDERNHVVFEGNLSEIAELLGTSYRHLLRTLNILCEQGIIQKNNKYFEILKPDKLETLAGDLYE